MRNFIFEVTVIDRSEKAERDFIISAYAIDREIAELEMKRSCLLYKTEPVYYKLLHEGETDAKSSRTTERTGATPGRNLC